MNTPLDTSIPLYLDEPPPGISEAPLVTLLQELPFEKLNWENFERLCYRLIRLESDVEFCTLYGTPGQDQKGIDIYARQKLTGKYRVYQCKRVNNFGSSKIKSAVCKFLQGEWADRANTFVLCTTESLRKIERLQEIETQRDLLNQKGIKLLIWGKDELSAKLKDYPNLVYDFFNRDYVVKFCGQEKADKLDNNNSPEYNEQDSLLALTTPRRWLTPIATSPPPEISLPIFLKNFLPIGKATISPQDNGIVEITGGFTGKDIPDLVWITHKLPCNFEVNVSVEIQDLESQFILGLGNKEDWSSNYQFVMTPNWTAFKKIDFLKTEPYETYFVPCNSDNDKLYLLEPFTINPYSKFLIRFKRMYSRIFLNMTINNISYSLYDVSGDKGDFSLYNYLFISSNQCGEGVYHPGKILVKFENNIIQTF